MFREYEPVGAGNLYRMNPASDLISGIVGFILSLFVFSYLIGDNPLFRIATYLFVGVSSGYICALAWWQILWPNLVQPLMFGSLPVRMVLLPPLLASGFLLMKIWPRLGFLGTPVMAFIVGVGAASAVGGAILGTLGPQLWAGINTFDPGLIFSQGSSWLGLLWNGAFVLIGTVTSLAYFHFGAHSASDGTVRRLAWIEWLAAAGSIFIAVTLGVIYAGVYSAALTALIERISSLLNFIL